MLKDILVVDDEIIALKIFEQTIKRAGFKAVCFTKGKQAMDWVKIHKPDLAIFDYNMPDINGQDMIKFFKGNQTIEKIPIIVVTGHRELELKETLFNEGANCIILKPYSPTLLAKKIQKLAA